MAISTTPVTSISGTGTGTTVTVTLPTYSLSNYMVMFVASNNGNTQTISSPVAATILANASNRLIAYKLVPINGSQTSFTITVSGSSVFTWWIGTYSGVDAAATVVGNGNNIGNNSTSAIEIPVSTAQYILTGNELVLWAGSVNSTATWTTDSHTVFNTTSGNAALMVSGANPTTGNLSYVPSNMDRGNNASARNESAMSVILQPTSNNATVNLLSNPSFEQGATLATGWEDEHTTVIPATYSLTATGSVDGAVAQQIAYTGQPSDTTGIVEIFQSPVSGMLPGDVIIFSCYISGSLTNAYGFIGIEGFDASNAYLSETDTNFITLNGTPTLYTVSYTCPPTNDHVAVYMQVPSIGPTVAFTIRMDKATLVKSTAFGDIKVWDGSQWTAKPMKVWSGSTWTKKPLKVYNGSELVTTNY